MALKIIKKEAILELLNSRVKTSEELSLIKRKMARKYNIEILQNSDIIQEYRDLLAKGKINEIPSLERLLRKRAVRTLSGIAPVAVLTKPYPCPGECVYCPTEPNVPQSYLSNEPAVMRAIRCNYDPYVQVQDRLRALIANGHEPTKIELIVIGGTWSCYPKNYQYWYIANCFAGANQFAIKSEKSPAAHCTRLDSARRAAGQAKVKMNSNLKGLLKAEQKKNETAKYKIIGITLETRPDYIKEKELVQMRELGCTRVELGVQAIDDKILKLNKRGHGVEAIVWATKLLKNYGFKVTYHIMPGLPGATSAKDLKMFKQLFTDERFQPDQIKFYPTVVTKGSILYKWWQAGKYKPYSNKILEKLIADCKKVIPPYVRVIRLIRDIPGESIVAGNLVTNLRQVMQTRGVKCQCIRCREVKSKKLKVKSKMLGVVEYQASEGKEYFIQFTDETGKILYGFCRLRIPSNNIEHIAPKTLINSALIRELHIYGELVPLGKRKRVQHAGLGKKLLKEAEKIARNNGYNKIAVISGVGVRDYYRKFGYRLKDTYMVKIIK
jgi:elongator complex protein 3